MYCKDKVLFSCVAHMTNQLAVVFHGGRETTPEFIARLKPGDYIP